MSQRLSILLVLLLVSLLSLQLTGLSCLEDWVSVHSHGSVVLSSVSDEAYPASESGADACPCHFSLAHSLSIGTDKVGPSQKAPVSLPSSHLVPLARSLFHPPVLA